MKAFIVGLIGVMVVSVVIVGCSKETAQSSATQTAEPLPAHLIATTQPAGAVDISVAKTQAKDGDAIVVRGRVGGQKDPLAGNRAVMTIADMSLPRCDKTPMDTCATPWDSCCEPVDVIASKSATVQVVGADGKPLKSGLKGAGGIAPGKNVVVAGIAKVATGGGSLVIEATQIYVSP